MTCTSDSCARESTIRNCDVYTTEQAALVDLESAK